jgi:hypothetical protein
MWGGGLSGQVGGKESVAVVQRNLPVTTTRLRVVQ